jgi:hypothetical protein
MVGLVEARTVDRMAQGREQAASQRLALDGAREIKSG